MVDKRLKKLEVLKEDIIPPVLIGPEAYRFLILGWGSSFPMIQEALVKMGRTDIALLHFNQLYPLSEKILEYLKKAERIILVEGNATGQFGKLIKLNTGFEMEEKILKYNGMPFSVEEIIEKITKCLARRE